MNLAPAEDTPALQRASTPILKHRTPSLPVDSADPLNALPPDSNDSALKSLAGALEASYKLFWNQVKLVEPPRTLDDVRRLVSRPFIDDPPKEKPEPPPASLSKLIVGSGIEHKPEDPGRGNLMYGSPFSTLLTLVLPDFEL